MDLRTKSLNRLMSRRATLQVRLDELASGPAAYTIQGSVSVTNPKVEELQRQIDLLDDRIAALLDPPEFGGIRRTFPAYRRNCN